MPPLAGYPKFTCDVWHEGALLPTWLVGPASAFSLQVLKGGTATYHPISDI